MEKVEFQKIMDALSDRIWGCELQLLDIHTTSDLSKLTLGCAAALKHFCVAEEQIMTKIAMVDLYHIIGMGELTPPQMMKFTYAIREYLQYRPTIKAIAKGLDSIFDLPKIPVETQYKLQGLGNITLTSNFDGPATTTLTEKEPKQVSLQQKLLPFRLCGNQIKVDMPQFDFFVTLMANLFNSPLSAENFRRKITNKGDYLGITWVSYDGYEAVGQIKSAETAAKLLGYYNNRI